MYSTLNKSLLLGSVIALVGSLQAVAMSQHVPENAPRTWVLPEHRDAFLEFSTLEEGSVYFERIREDFDAHWMDWPFPAEPEPYGDPDPRKRTREMVNLWRAMQDLTGQVTGVAEAATLIWLVTGEEPYLEKAKTFLLEASQWDPHGPTGVYYNDEAHFRLFRKLPAIYDQLRDELTSSEREIVVNHLRERGRTNFENIVDRGVGELIRNSVERRPASHAVRFMPMTGVAALALWDDIPEAQEWWDYVYRWYRDVFTPWGGDDGGWAEGVAYWRGVYEHAIFQDALLSIGDPIAYNLPFWQNTGDFMVYFVNHYPTTGFGDLSNAGQFNMEPGVKHFLEHLARVTGKGYYQRYAEFYSDPRPLPTDMGMERLYRLYPTATEYWIREFQASAMPRPEPSSLSEIPQSRHFRGIGWVAMRSDMDDPQNDIQLAFKSSKYGSFSHSHADQNSFIINAFGEQLAINSGYREYHRSHMHKYYTRHTYSKNNILINRRGQEVQDLGSTGEIIRFETGDRYVWTTGDATVAFNTMQPRSDELEKVHRDILFVDDRYFVVRDHVVQRNPGRIDWLLHARDPINFQEADGSVTIERRGVYLFGKLIARDNDLKMKAWTGFPIDVDPLYKDMRFIEEQVYLREPALDQAHFQANTVDEKADQMIFAVLWPSKDRADAGQLHARLNEDGSLTVERPDGGTDRIRFLGNKIVIE